MQGILELGELIVILAPEDRPYRVTLMAVQLAGDGVARSTDEGYVMLMEAYAHAHLMQYKDDCEEEMKQATQLCEETNEQLRLLATYIKTNGNLRATITTKGGGYAENTN